MSLIERLEESLHGWLITAIHWLPALIVGIVVFVIFLFIAKAARWAVCRLIPVATPDSRHLVRLVLSRMARWFVIILGALLALSIMSPSFHARDLINLLGISGVAIGFAFRDILQNFLAGIILMLSNAFSIGDTLQIDDFKGVVTDIRTRATFLEGEQGTVLMVPNAYLFTNKIRIFPTQPQGK